MNYFMFGVAFVFFVVFSLFMFVFWLESKRKRIDDLKTIRDRAHDFLDAGINEGDSGIVRVANGIIRVIDKLSETESVK